MARSLKRGRLIAAWIRPPGLLRNYLRQPQLLRLLPASQRRTRAVPLPPWKLRSSQTRPRLRTAGRPSSCPDPRHSRSSDTSGVARPFSVSRAVSSRRQNHPIRGRGFVASCQGKALPLTPRTQSPRVRAFPTGTERRTADYRCPGGRRMFPQPPC
jgi:hypothetical protein